MYEEAEAMSHSGPNKPWMRLRRASNTGKRQGSAYNGLCEQMSKRNALNKSYIVAFRSRALIYRLAVAVFREAIEPAHIGS